jgi:hypothetical protein
MNKKLLIGLVSIGTLVIGSVAYAQSSFLDRLLELTSTKITNAVMGTQSQGELKLGATQTYPLHTVQNPSSYDQLFTWGVLENAGTTWLTGAVGVSSTLTVSGATTLASSLTVGTSFSAATTTLSGHLISGGGTPAAPVVGGASWVAGTLTGNDTAGTVSSTAAASTPGQITVNFATAFSSAPRCVISLANTLAGVDATSTGRVFVTSSVSAFSINFPIAVPPSAYVFNYLCLQ